MPKELARKADHARPRPPQPGVVMGVVVWLLLRALYSLLSCYTGLRQTLDVRLECVWAVVTAVFLIGPLLSRSRWAWSMTTGIVYVHCAFVVARWASALASSIGGGLNSIPHPTAILFSAIYPALLLLLAFALFRAREWFGVEPRHGWRTMLREGGWAMAVSLAIHGLSLLPFRVW